ncbi:MAG: copper resistance protein CopC [Micrococcaceae bacterium]
MIENTPLSVTPGHPEPRRRSGGLRHSLTAGTALGLGAVLLLATAPGALAHDELLESTPASGETLTETPQDVILTFSGTPLDGEGLTNLIDITDANGDSWVSGDVTVAGYDLTTDTCEGMPNGDYTLGYRVVYSDGHVGEESFSFTLDDPDAPSAEEATAPGEGCEIEAAPSEPAAEDSADATESAESAEPAESAETDAASETAPVAPAVPSWVWIAVLAALVVIALGAVWVIRAVRQHDGSTPTGNGPDQA